jgi:hypothetical protein
VRFLPWTRRLPFWNTLADYFPVRLHKSCDLDPKVGGLYKLNPVKTHSLKVPGYNP